MASLCDQDIAHLQSICGAERSSVGEGISDDFTHDELGEARVRPAILLEPCSAEEVSCIMRYAGTRRIPVTVRGSGTGLAGACVPEEGGILLSVARMDRILEIDEQNLLATVEPGLVLMNFQEILKQREFMYGPDPGERSASIGGNVSTNAGGMRALKYGVTRDHVTGLEVVLPDGRIVSIGGKVRKNSSGYSLLHLLVGSEGTLGVITKITVRLLPLPPLTRSLLVPFDSPEAAVRMVPLILRQRLLPTAMEFVPAEVILSAEHYLGRPFPHNTAPAYLLLRFDGTNGEELHRMCMEAGRLCLEQGAEDVLIADTAEREEMLWSVRSACLHALKALSPLDEVDIVVPRDQMAAFFRYAGQVEEEQGLRIRAFGHAGDGNLHVYLLRDELDQETWRAKRDRAMEKLYARVSELGGQVSGEHGIGLAKRPYLAKSLDPALLTLMRGVKAAFDPHGIMNPGKVFDSGTEVGTHHEAALLPQ